jgi:hypothetical protein
MKEEEQKPAGWGEFPPKQEITIITPKKLKSGQTYQDQNKYWQSQGQAPIYKTNEAGSPAQQAAVAIAMKKAGKKPKQVDEASRGSAIKQGQQDAAKGLSKQQNPYYESVNGQTPPEAYDWEAGWEDARDTGKIPQGVAEGQWNYPKPMTTIPKFDKEADDYLGLHQGDKFAKKNKDDRKEWRKTQKAQAHKELMTGKK